MSPLFLFRAILTWDFKSNLVFSEDRLPFLFISRHLLCDAMDTPTQNRRATVSTRCYWGDVLDTVYTSPILFNLIISGIFSINNARVPLFLLQASKSLTVGFPWFLKVVLTRYRLLYGLVYPVLSHKSKLVDIKYSGLEFLAMSSRRNQVEQSARFKSVHGF